VLLALRLLGPTDQQVLLGARDYIAAGVHGPQRRSGVLELEAQLKAQQVYEQSNGQAVWSLGAAFWELRFPKG